MTAMWRRHGQHILPGIMRQGTELMGKQPRRKIGPRGLRTLRAVTEEMRRVYCEARNGTFEGGWAAAGTAARLLERLRYAMASTELDERLDALEARLDLRGGGLPRVNGYGAERDRPGVLP
jgi:hypothetical protein